MAILCKRPAAESLPLQRLTNPACPMRVQRGSALAGAARMLNLLFFGSLAPPGPAQPRQHGQQQQQMQCREPSIAPPQAFLRVVGDQVGQA